MVAGILTWILSPGRILGLADSVIKFLTSPAGIVVMFLAYGWYQNHQGRIEAREACSAAQVAAENRQLKASLEKAQRINDENREQLEREQLAVDQLQEKVAQYAQEQDSACMPTDDDLRRDRDIRGVR